MLDRRRVVTGPLTLGLSPHLASTRRKFDFFFGTSPEEWAMSGDDDEATRTMRNAFAAMDWVQERVLAFGKQVFKTGDVVSVHAPGQHHGKTGKVCEFFWPSLYTIELADGQRVPFPFGDLRKVVKGDEAP
jgi:hypothetical protein